MDRNLTLSLAQVGLHEAHHDVPNVPWTRLPEVVRIAPEFYTNPTHSSWPGVIWTFITGTFFSLRLSG